MERILDQIVASTGPDSHGERLTDDQMRSLFDSAPDPWVLVQEHNLASKPVAIGSNKRLKRSPSGDLQLVVDIDVLDPTAFVPGAGFSISFVRRTIVIGNGPSPVALLINGRQFDLREIVRELKTLVPPELSVEVGDRADKGETQNAIIVIVLSATLIPMLKGFMTKLGERLFEMLINCRRIDSHGSLSIAPVIQLQLRLPRRGREVLVVLKSDPTATAADFARIDYGALATELESYVFDEAITRVVGSIAPGARVEFESLIRADGTCLPFQHQWPNTRHV